MNVGAYIIGSSLILGGFSLGLGPITWLLQSEIFPTLIRGRAMGFSVIMRNLGEFLINFTFLTIVQKIGNDGIFFMFFLLCLSAFLFVYFFFVETKEKEPDEILTEFEINFMKLFQKKTGGSYLCVNDDSMHDITPSPPPIIPTRTTTTGTTATTTTSRKGVGYERGIGSIEINPLGKRKD